MSSRRSARQLLVAVLLGVLVGGGLMAVTPAGAEVSQSVATSWKKIWKKNLRPLADRRYYTKAQSDAKYQPQGAYETAGSGYTKAETYSRAETYGKAESDARFAPFPTLLTGAYGQQEDGSTLIVEPLSWGFRLAAAPTTHYIETGDPVPAGCSGTAEAPNADPGHLCVFESGSSNVGPGIIASPTLTAPGLRVGAFVGATRLAAGAAWMRGTWALRPGGAATVSAPAAAAAGGGTNKALTDNGSLLP